MQKCVFSLSRQQQWNAFYLFLLLFIISHCTTLQPDQRKQQGIQKASEQTNEQGNSFSPFIFFSFKTVPK